MTLKCRGWMRNCDKDFYLALRGKSPPEIEYDYHSWDNNEDCSWIRLTAYRPIRKKFLFFEYESKEPIFMFDLDMWSKTQIISWIKIYNDFGLTLLESMFDDIIKPRAQTRRGLPVVSIDDLSLYERYRKTKMAGIIREMIEENKEDE